MAAQPSPGLGETYRQLRATIMANGLSAMPSQGKAPCECVKAHGRKPNGPALEAPGVHEAAG